MRPSFIQEEMAREHTRSLSVAAQRAAESRLYRRSISGRSRLGKALGRTLVRLAVRLAGPQEAAKLAGQLTPC